MIAAAAFLALAAAALLLVRLSRGPTLLDRVAASHGVWTLAALALAALGVAAERTELLAAACALILVDAALVFAGVKALRLGAFAAPLAALKDDER